MNNRTKPCPGFAFTLIVKNPGPEGPALDFPWKGLLATAGVETQNSGARSQESADVAMLLFILSY